MVDDQLLSRGQLAELLLMLIGVVGLTLIYAVYGLLNGYGYTNQIIRANLIPLTAFSVLLISFIPVYSRHDHLFIKILKKASWLMLIAVMFFIIWIYYFFYPPTTGLARLTFKFSYIVISASVIPFGLALYSGYQTKQIQNQ